MSPEETLAHYRAQVRQLEAEAEFRGCCGVPEPHTHMCYLGPLGWVVFRLWQWLGRRA